MYRFETVQGDVWEGDQQIHEQLARINRLRERGLSVRQAIRDLQDIEETQEHLRHHRDILRWSLGRPWIAVE